MPAPLLPPAEPVEFFRWLKAASEHRWANVAVRPEIFGFQVQSGTRWLPGLAEREIVHFEAALGCSFPPIYRLFLMHMNGTDKPAVNVYGVTGEPYRYSPAYYSYPRDLAAIRQRIAWIYDAFAVTPEIVERQRIPHIVPLTGHRFLVVDRCESHLVLSMHGRDTIPYAPSLQTFLVNDIFGDHLPELGDISVDVRFWLDAEEHAP